ncbi:MAG: ATP-binding protein [Candidatus Limnocylindria bacterium]
MSGNEVINLLDQVVYLSLFLLVTWRAVRRPTAASLDTTLFFGTIAALIVLPWGIELAGRGEDPVAGTATFMIVNVLPFLILRLVDRFAETPRWLLPGALIFLLVSTALIAVAGSPLPAWVLLLAIAWFAVVGVYSTFAFARQARSSLGVTQRRMIAVTTGFVLVVLAVVVAFAGALIEGTMETTLLIARAVGLGAGVAFFAGFVPPVWLRRAWQEPELHAFLSRATRLRTTDRAATIASLEVDVARALGAAGASIGLYDPATGQLVYTGRDGTTLDFGAEELIGGRAFTLQRPIVSLDAPRDDPEHAAVYREFRALAVLAVPITAGERRWGVLGVYAGRPSIFVEDDIRLLQLMADQIAAVFDSLELVGEAARMRAREDATQLKEDFLSAAAHDLRTPLTVMLAQAELLERRLERDPSTPIDPASMARVAREARRLRDLVRELLDAQRMDGGRLIGERVEFDVAQLAAEVCARHAENGSACRMLAANRALMAAVDPLRIEQVLDNLLENADKYGAGGPVEMRVWADDGEARISVTDHGIGIPADDMPRVFERFFRASNVDGRQRAGMGLGLFICRRIVEEHGGRIWAESRPGEGSTFHVALPMAPAVGATEPRSVAPMRATPPAPLDDEVSADA